MVHSKCVYAYLCLVGSFWLSDLNQLTDDLLGVSSNSTVKLRICFPTS